MFQPRSCRIGQEQWKVADNEIIIIYSTGLARKPIILEPQSGVRFLGVFRDVGWRSVPRWEDGVEDVSAKGLRSQQVKAQASVFTAVVASATTTVVATASLLPHITMGTPAGIEGVACVTVMAKMLMHRDRGALHASLWILMDQHVPAGVL